MNGTQRLIFSALTMMWFWRTDDESWDLFNETDCVALEAAHTAGQALVALAQYDIDMASMLQTNRTSGHIRRVHRGWPDPDPTPQYQQEEEDDEEEENSATDEDSESEEGDTDEKFDASLLKMDPPEMIDAAPSAFICVVSLGIMQDPVMTTVGSTYEKVMIQQWLRKHATDPLTNQCLTDKRLIENRSLRDAIQNWKEDYLKKKSDEEEEDKKLAAKPTPPKQTSTSNDHTVSIDDDVQDDVVETTLPAESSSDDPYRDLEEGESRQISKFTVKLTGGIYSCSCPGWKYKGGSIATRVCKHLAMIRRSTPAATSNKRKRDTSHLQLAGKSICFTGALSLTRAKAQELAVQFGATVDKSVTRTTQIVVVGK